VTETFIVPGVFDEAGDTGSSAGSSSHLVVAGVVSPSLDPLRRVIMRTRKMLGKDLRQMPEFKAGRTPHKLACQMLNRIAQLDVQVYSAILDKRSAVPPEDLEERYRRVFAECLRLVVAHHPRVLVTMDRRYTKASLQDRLVNALVASAQPFATSLSFVLAESRREKALQVADLVAWSIFQKYAHQETGFYELIEERIRGEVLLLQ
jgi:hypothetical protein